MALEALSGAAYHDAAKPAQNISRNANISEQSTVQINISEVPSAAQVLINQNGKEQEKGQKDNGFSDQQIKEAISRANNKMKSHRTRCEFSYHEETNRVSIKVLDKDTEEVIREIPPEETLEMIEKMWELAGLLVDERR